MIRLSLLALVVFLMAAKPVPSDSSEIIHNSPPIVEKQSGALCAPIEDCVTNTGPCVWDSDDVLTGSAFDGEWTGCLFADGSDQHYHIIATSHKRDDPAITVTIDPPIRLVGGGGPVWTFDSYEWGRKYRQSRGCVSIDLGFGNELEEIPLQGGGGLVHGYAVPVTITIRSEGAISVAKRGLEGCP